jgi:uncharacterized protein DUF6152
MRRSGLSLAAIFFALSGSAVAHHSGAMFDQDHKITLSGTVREFQWTNPHCYIQFTVLDKQGQPEEWSLEMAAPIYLQQRGWRPSTLKPGDQLTVILSPLRKMTTRKGGLVFSASDATGKQIGKPFDSSAPSQALSKAAEKSP